MGRGRKNKDEVRIVRGISVSPSFWQRFKAWCRGKSMSEMIEIAILRMMDEQNDVLSLTLQTEELRNKISTKRFEYKKMQAELELRRFELEAELNLRQQKLAFGGNVSDNLPRV